VQYAEKQSQKQKVLVEQSDIQSTVVNYFTSYYKVMQDDVQEEEQVVQTPDFSTIQKYLDETTATVEDVLYSLITGIIEEKHEHI
jgi:hypothetical protein